ncbi:MAG: transporter [Candidatus Accumulibacter sp.]|nr:transporter [Accumulibacter sp.]MBA4093162.1 transporter [Accumulibacter sp.]
MNHRFHPLFLGVALAAGASLLGAGCNRQEATSSGSAATTTVGTEIDDTVLTAKATSALLGDPDVKGFDIKVESRKGVLLLSGFVDNQTQVDRALEVARRVEGVKGVENGMTLKAGKLTVGNQVDDGMLTGHVKAALLSEPSIRSFDIAVVTRKGEVQLSGFVDNQAQIDRALEVARSVEGVHGVVNEMSVKK